MEKDVRTTFSVIYLTITLIVTKDIASVRLALFRHNQDSAFKVSVCCKVTYELAQIAKIIGTKLFLARKVKETRQSTVFSFALLVIPLAVLCCLFLLCVRVIHVLIKNQDSSKTDETIQDDGSGLDDAETFSMTVFNSVKEEDGHNEKDRSPFQDIIELKEEEDQDQEVFSSKDVQNAALDESIILRKSLRKGEGGMYFEEYLV